MSKFILIRDSDTKVPYGAIVVSKNGPTCIGNISQADDWASWANRARVTTQEILDSLDFGLDFEKEKILNAESISAVSEILSPKTLDKLKDLIEGPVLKIEKKSLPEEMDDFYSEDEFELISEWPITDVALSLIEVQFKRSAVNFKAKAFISDKASSSLLLGVKGVRAVWDPDSPGGGAWRCPPTSGDTAGQFTNRFGRGCLPGMARRLGSRLIDLAGGDLNTPLGERGALLEATGDLRSAQSLARASRRQANKIRSEQRRIERRIAKLEEPIDTDVVDTYITKPKARSNRRNSRAERLAQFADRISGQRVKPKLNEPDFVDADVVTSRTARRADERSGAGEQFALPPAPADVVTSEDSENVLPSSNRRVKKGKTPKISPIDKKIRSRSLTPDEDFEANRRRGKKRKKVGKTPDSSGESMRSRAAQRLDRLANRLSKPKTDYSVLPNESPKANKPVGVRQRARSVSLSKTNPRSLMYGNIVPSQRVAKTIKDWDAYTPTEQASIEDSMKKARTRLENGWRKRIGLNPSDDLTEESIEQWMSNLAKTQPRKAAIIKNQAHNIVVLDDFLDSTEPLYPKNKKSDWASLKPGLREWILEDAGLLSKNTAKTPRQKPTAPVAPKRPRKTNQPSLPVDATQPTTQDIAPQTTAPEDIDPASTEIDTPDVLNVDSVDEPTNDEVTNVVIPAVEHGTMEAAENAQYVIEEYTGLLRDPISGQYKEDYSDYPITLDTEFIPMQPYPPMQRSSKTGLEIVSYPKIKTNVGSPGGQDRFVSLAPGTHENSVDSYRQSRDAIWESLPDRVKKEYPGLQIVDIPPDADGTPGTPGSVTNASGFNSFFSGRRSYRSNSLVSGIDEDVIPSQPLFIAKVKDVGWSYSTTEASKVMESINQALVSNDGSAWYAAWQDLKRAHSDAVNSRDSALADWRRTPKNNQRQRRDFVLNGELAESLEAIAERVFPAVFPRITESIKNAMETSAKVRNRLAVARVKAQQDGTRVIGGVDPTLLAPLKDEEGNLILRTPTEIRDLFDTNRTLGLFEPQPLVLQPGEEYQTSVLSEGKIDYFNTVQMAREQQINYNTLEQMDTPTRALHTAAHGLNGYNEPTVVASPEEFESLLKMLDDDDQPMFIPIVRGISRSKVGKSHKEMVLDYIYRDRYVTAGEGASAGGEGDNFSAAKRPITGYYGGSGEDKSAILALIPRTGRIMGRAEMSVMATQIRQLTTFFNKKINRGDGQSAFSADRYSDNDVDRVWRELSANSMLPIPQNAIWSDQASVESLYSSILAVLATDRPADNDFKFEIPDYAIRNYAGNGYLDGAIGGPDWFAATRNEIFGWYVQLEIAKNALYAMGLTDEDEQVKRLYRAQEYIRHLDDEVLFAPILGVDVYLSSSTASYNLDPVKQYLRIPPGKYDDESHIMVTNRTGLILFNEATSLDDAREWLKTIEVTKKDGTTDKPY
jgi:hypothetical protein